MFVKNLPNNIIVPDTVFSGIFHIVGIVKNVAMSRGALISF